MLDGKRQRVIDVLVSTLAGNERLEKENVRLRGMCDKGEADIRRLLTQVYAEPERASWEHYSGVEITAGIRACL